MTTLVTGGGYIGSRIAWHLLGASKSPVDGHV